MTVYLIIYLVINSSRITIWFKKLYKEIAFTLYYNPAHYYYLSKYCS